MKAMKHGLGRRAHSDPRDREHLLAAHLPSEIALPSSKLWPITSRHLNQGQTLTCVGHAWCNFLRCAPVRTKAGEPEAYDIYRSAVLLDPWEENDGEAELPDADPGFLSGTTVRAGAKAVAARGELTTYLWSFSLQPTLEWLLTRGPVVVGVNWYDSFSRPDRTGLVRISPGAVVVGGHSFLVRGANQRGARVRNVNSWDDDWAHEGDFYLSYQDFERLIHEDGEVCTAIQAPARKRRTLARAA